MYVVVQRDASLYTFVCICCYLVHCSYPGIVSHRKGLLFQFSSCVRYVFKSAGISPGLTITRLCHGWRPHCSHAPAIRTVLNRIAPAIESTLWLPCCLERIFMPTDEYITLLDHLHLYSYIHAYLCSNIYPHIQVVATPTCLLSPCSPTLHPPCLALTIERSMSSNA